MSFSGKLHSWVFKPSILHRKRSFERERISSYNQLIRQ